MNASQKPRDTLLCAPAKPGAINATVQPAIEKRFVFVLVFVPFMPVPFRRC